MEKVDHAERNDEVLEGHKDRSVRAEITQITDRKNWTRCRAGSSTFHDTCIGSTGQGVSS